jgi:type I restriction enzyme S subunit
MSNGQTYVGDMIELAYGRSLSADNRKTGSVPVYGSNGIVGYHNDSAVDGPGIVVGRKGSVGALAFSEGPFWPIDTTYFVVNKGAHDWRFLYHFLRSLGLTGLNSHSAVPGLNREDVYSIEVSLPAREEEPVIGQVLDEIEVAVAREDATIGSHQKLKRAVMRDLFTHGLRGEAQMDSEIGPVPESWEIKTLLELCTICSGGTPRKSVAEYWNGDLPWVSGKDLKKPILDDAIDHISAEGAAAGSKVAPADAVLVLVRGMGLAKDLPVARISRPMAFNQDLKALISKGHVTGAFLRSAIYNRKDALLSRIVPSAHGTMTLNLDDLESFKIGCPTNADEVAEITATLDAIDAKIDLHKRKKVVLEELFRALLHKLMKGEVRVADLDLSALQSHQKVAA